jgi:hypothetical protein
MVSGRPSVTPYLDRWGRPVRRRNRWTHVSHPWNGPVWRLDRSDWDLEFDGFERCWYLWTGGSMDKPVDRYLDGAMEWCEQRYRELARKWHLELSAEFPDLEIYFGGWGPEQELSQYELGERVMEEETSWLFTWIYSGARDRHWAAAGGMCRMVIERIRRDRPEAERILRVLAGEDPDAVELEEIPAGWRPDTDAWEAGKFNDPPEEPDLNPAATS